MVFSGRAEVFQKHLCSLIVAGMCGLLFWGASPIGAQVPQPGVGLSVDEIEQVANRVRAGRSLQPEHWPNGARVAVLLSFDVDNDTITLARNATPSIGAMSQGEYGARVGLQRVVDLIDRHAIPASFFIPAVSLILKPDMVDVIQQSGRHEFGVHGWIHELNTELDAETERDLVGRATDYLEEVTGRRPVGYRAPSWNFSPNTLRIIRGFGFLYDSSLMADDRPYELLENGEATGIVELPVEWILDDAPLLNPRGTSYTSPRELLQVYIDEFDKAYEEGTMFVLTTHPHIIGHRSRILILEELISHIQSFDDVWFATHEQVARYVLEQNR
jgi:peptidoglycan/xylan/chitin deacetylase (PgdA/CDA1 family)